MALGEARRATGRYVIVRVGIAPLGTLKTSNPGLNMLVSLEVGYVPDRCAGPLLEIVIVIMKLF